MLNKPAAYTLKKLDAKESTFLPVHDIKISGVGGTFRVILELGTISSFRQRPL